MDIGTALLPLGIIPALLILYLTLGGYEEKFKNKYIFLTFLGGIFLGTIIFFIELWIISGLNVEIVQYLLDIIVISLSFSFLEQLAKLVVLNLPRFQKEEGVPIYGASFGLGFASPGGAVVLGITKIKEIFSVSGIGVAILALSILLVSCSTGIWVGVAVKKRERIKGLLISSLAGVLIWISLFYHSEILLTTLIFGYALFLYLYAYRRTLPFHLLGRKTKKKILEKRFFK